MEKVLRSRDKESGQLYKFFSAKKSEEFKTQMAHLRASEMTEMISKEWYAMKEQEKSVLKVELNEKKLKDSGKKTAAAKEDQVRSQDNVPVTISLKHELFQKNIKPEIKLKEIVQEAKQEIKLIKTEQYQQFFKYCYDKLSKEHSRWNSQKVSIIIGLLWRRRQQHKKKPLQVRKTKPVPGRIAFKKAKIPEGYQMKEIIKMWKKLPAESKKMWKTIGGQEKPKDLLTVKATTMSLRPIQKKNDQGEIMVQESSQRQFGFMNKFISKQ